MYIEHIAMYVENLEAAKDFFIKYLGGRSNNGYHNVKTGFRSYFITFDSGPRLELMYKEAISWNGDNSEKSGYSHIAFSLGNKERVDELTEILRKDGYTVVSGPRVTGDGYYESSIIVIEGNRIELTL